MTFLQLGLFGNHVNTLPTPSAVVELGPAPTWCRDCWEDTYPVPHPRDAGEWVCENIREMECGCYEHGGCGTCEACDDCCECVWCNGCEEAHSSDDHCGHCDRCRGCCECVRCEGRYCSRRFSYDLGGGCMDCYRCDYCGCECESEEDEDSGCDCSACRRPPRTEAPPADGKTLVGIEVEFVGLSQESGSRVIRETHGLSGWQVKYDGSVAYGGELVSPPLDWSLDESREALYVALEALKRAGADTSPSAGVHVHVDARDLTHAQVARVGVWSADFADQLFRIGSSGWATIRHEGVTNYCKPIRPTVVDELELVTDERSFAQAWYGRDTTQGVGAQHYHDSRYHAVNLHSWVYRGTVEFRVFNSSLSPLRVATYVNLCVAVVESARAGKTPKPAVRYYLGEMVAQRVTENEAFRAMVNGLGSFLTPSAVRGLEHCWADSRPQVAPERCRY